MVRFNGRINLIIVDLVSKDKPLALLFNPAIISLYQPTPSFMVLQYFLTTLDFWEHYKLLSQSNLLCMLLPYNIARSSLLFFFFVFFFNIFWYYWATKTCTVLTFALQIVILLPQESWEDSQIRPCCSGILLDFPLQCFSALVSAQPFYWYL